jgi:hypothetical protein
VTIIFYRILFFHFSKINSNKIIQDTMANELLDYFEGNLKQAKCFAELICLPHHHHHEKKIKKTASAASLIKINGSNNHLELYPRKGIFIRYFILFCFLMSIAFI